MWVIRVSKDGSFQDAKPCSKCCKLLFEFGFRKIAFSNNDGDIEIVNLKNFTNDHLSAAQRLTEKYCRY